MMKKKLSEKKEIEYEFNESENEVSVREGVFIIENDVWSTQKRISKIYGRSIPTVNDHVKKVIDEGEVDEKGSIMKIRITQKEGKKMVTRETLVYNTDVIISIGFRVGGEWGKEFRVWAREIVKENYDPKGAFKYM